MESPEAYGVVGLRLYGIRPCRDGVGFAAAKQYGLVFNAEFSVDVGIDFGQYNIWQASTNKLPALKNRLHCR